MKNNSLKRQALQVILFRNNFFYYCHFFSVVIQFKKFIIGLRRLNKKSTVKLAASNRGKTLNNQDKRKLFGYL